MKNKHFIAIFLVLFTFSACNDKKENDEGRKTNFSIVVDNDIASFNLQTREIVFKSGEIIDKNLSSNNSSLKI